MGIYLYIDHMPGKTQTNMKIKNETKTSTVKGSSAVLAVPLLNSKGSSGRNRKHYEYDKRRRILHNITTT